MTKKKPQTGDKIDIREILDGSITSVIAELQKLAVDYPEGAIEIGTHNEYGETYHHAYLEYVRDKTPAEIELDEWREKSDRYDRMRKESAVFAANGAAYPKADEAEALRKELGFFAMAPMRAMLVLDDDEVIAWDHSRGGRRRDGTWKFHVLGFGGSDKIAKLYEAMDAEYMT